ncbi:MAG: DUF4433 domain-containing protein [Phycisphaerae bacterium]
MLETKNFKTELAKHDVIYLYHLTALRNVGSILAFGIFSYNAAQDVPHSDISWSEVQARRTKGFLASSLNLHYYVPLFFATHTPMQYVLTHPTTHSQPVLMQDQLAILIVDAQQVFSYPGILFTDGNAASYDTKFLNEPDELEEVNWSIIRNTTFCYTRDLKRRKSAEVLIPQHLPSDAISEIIVYNEHARNNLTRELDLFIKKIKPIVPVAYRQNWIDRCEADSHYYF